MQDQCDWVDLKSGKKRRSDKQAELHDQVNSDAQSKEGNAGGSR